MILWYPRKSTPKFEEYTSEVQYKRERERERNGAKDYSVPMQSIFCKKFIVGKKSCEKNAIVKFYSKILDT